MRRSRFAPAVSLGFAVVLILSTLSSTAAEKSSLLGKVQPEIRLTDGTVFKKAKIVDFSLDKSTATIAEPTRIRVVPIEKLPPALRDQLLAEAGVKPATPPKTPARHSPRPYQPPPQTGAVASTAPAPVAAPPSSSPSRDHLLQQAALNAPAQLKAHLTHAYGQVGSLATQVVETADVPGWPRIRVSGETSFTERSPGQRVSSLRQEKFEIEYSVTPAGALKPETITVGGISRPFLEK